MSEEQSEAEVPPEEGEAGEGEAGEADAGDAEAGEGENETEATTGDEAPDANNQESQEQEPAESDMPSPPVEYTENEVQTDFTFSPTASNTDIARQLLTTLEAESGVEKPTETQDLDQEKEAEEDADKEETQEGEVDTEVTVDAADMETEQADSEQQEEEEQEETEIDDWIKERSGKKPKESRAMWDYSLYAPMSMVQDQIVETYEELVPIFAKLCEPMWDYDLIASPSMIESQVDETYELKLQLSSLKCEPMWDYQLSVPPEMALGQVYFEEKELQFDVSSLKCHPMWDYDLKAPIQTIPEEIYWVPSYLNFLGVTRENFFHIAETPNTKFIQTILHFDPDIIIQPEDLLGEPSEEDEEKRKCYTDPQYLSEEIADIEIESDETWYPTYLNAGELKKPYKLVGDRCVVEEADSETAADEPLEASDSESEEPTDEVISTEVQTDVGLGELLQSESISSVPEAVDESTNATDELTNATDELTNATDELTNATDELTNATDELTNATDELTNATDELTSVTDELNESQDQTLVGDMEPEESAPVGNVESITEETTGDETVEKGEPDVPWALLSETAVAPQPFLLPQEEDILSTVSLAPTAERQEDKFNFAVTIGGSVWGFPEYSTEVETPVSSTVLPQSAEEFTWVPDSSNPYESSVFAPISEEDAMLLESVNVDQPLESEQVDHPVLVSDSGSFMVSASSESDELPKEMSQESETEYELAPEQRDHSPTRAPVIEVEITMIPSAIAHQSSENVPQIEVGVAWEALPESLADGRSPDIIVTTVLEKTRKSE